MSGEDSQDHEMIIQLYKKYKDEIELRRTLALGMGMEAEVSYYAVRTLKHSLRVMEEKYPWLIL